MSSDSISEDDENNSIALMGEANTRAQQLQSSLGKSRAKISKLTVSSNKRVRTLSRRAKTHKATSLKQQKQMKQEMSTADKVLNAAQEAEQISNITIQAGDMTQNVGNIMVSVGTPMLSNPFTAAAGTALCNGGSVAMEVGHTVSVVGKVGVAVSAATQSVTHITQGNIKGAITSGLRAASAAASAAGGSQGLQKGLQAASKIANATLKNAENVKTPEANTTKRNRYQTGRAQRRGNA